MIKSNIKYWIFLSGFTLAIFLLNLNAINQIDTFYDVFRPISENILSGNGYRCPIFYNETLFYPLWGYTFITTIGTILGSAPVFLSIFQAFLSLIGIYYFYKLFRIEPRLLHIPLFLPFITLCSVCWPDAIAGFLLMPYAYYYYTYLKEKKLKHLIITGILLGLIVNFRSEYLYLPLLQIILTILPHLKGYRKLNLIVGAASLIIAFIMLVPWALRMYSYTGEFGLSASNGGAVMYISLGQLPDNPWHIQPRDKSAFDFAAKKGYKYPYSLPADNELKKEFNRLVKENPSAYAKKCLHNLLGGIASGVYTGEFGNTFIRKDRRFAIDSIVNAAPGLTDKVHALTNQKASESIPIIAEKIIQRVSIFFLLILIINFLLNLIISKRSTDKLLVALLGGIIIYKFLLISFIQFEYRHVNAIYLLLLGIMISSHYFIKKFLSLK